MKSSKSNSKILVATNFFCGIFVTTYQPTFVAYLNSFSALQYNHNGHRESTYVMVNRTKTLPNTYLELAEYQDSSCRLLRHSKILALVHSLNWDSLLPRVHWPCGTQRFKKVYWISYIMHPTKSRALPVQFYLL
jgi:hypothetical protein